MKMGLFLFYTAASGINNDEISSVIIVGRYDVLVLGCCFPLHMLLFFDLGL